MKYIHRKRILSNNMELSEWLRGLRKELPNLPFLKSPAFGILNNYEIIVFNCQLIKTIS